MFKLPPELFSNRQYYPTYLVFYTFFGRRPVLFAGLAKPRLPAGSVFLVFFAAAALALAVGGAGLAAVENPILLVGIIADRAAAFRAKQVSHFTPPSNVVLERLMRHIIERQKWKSYKMASGKDYKNMSFWMWSI